MIAARQCILRLDHIRRALGTPPDRLPARALDLDELLSHLGDRATIRATKDIIRNGKKDVGYAFIASRLPVQVRVRTDRVPVFQG